MKEILTVSAHALDQRILEKWENADRPTPMVYGVPRGGEYVVARLVALGLAKETKEPHKAEIIVDDIIDSGRTRDEHVRHAVPFWAPYDKFRDGDLPWVVFPWEQVEGHDSEASADKDMERHVSRIIQYIGDDPSREGVRETPARVVKSWKELYSGYRVDTKELLTKAMFDTDSDNIQVCRDIEFYSTCEHHMLPFHGVAHVGYLPTNKVTGLSKLARLVDAYARRMQIQENMTTRIAQDIMRYIPGVRGAGVVVSAKHMCMCGRGIGKQKSSMVTSSMFGVFRDDHIARMELMRLMGLG